MPDSARPTAVVVDASAAIALTRSESAGPPIASFIGNHRSSGGRLLVPDHFWTELTNVLVRRFGARPEDVVEVLREMDELGIESIRMERALMLGTIDVQHQHRLSAYDAMYLALARAEDARLLTLDARLAEAADERAILLDGMPPRRLTERPEAYGVEPLDWVRFGPYLAHLRAEALGDRRRDRGQRGQPVDAQNRSFRPR